MPEPALGPLQRWLSLLVRSPEPAVDAARQEAAAALVPRGAAIAGEVIRPTAALDPLARVDIYGGGYAARLVEVLESDFGALAYAAGTERWPQLARAYVYAHPSRHPNLNRFGAGLPAFVAAQDDLEHRAFLADLARLQWAVVEAFDAPRFAPLDTASLRALSEEQWAGVVLRTNPSLRLLTLDYPANRFLQDYLEDKLPMVPAPQTTHVAIYRKDGRVWRTAMPAAAFRILEQLPAGEPFAAALGAAGDEPVDVRHWFQEWSADHVFTAAELPR